MPKKDVKIKKPKNEICQNCLKWNSFQDKCHVFWEGKKECTLKVSTNEEWDEQNRFTNGLR